MTKVKLTKGELKKQRDSLRQYQRYLPTLQLKKQQLQVEILHLAALAQEKKNSASQKRNAIEVWCALLADEGISLKPWLSGRKVLTGLKNVAGVDIPVFEAVEFIEAFYDLFSTPLWVDSGLEALKALILLEEEIAVIEQAQALLKEELRITGQRVNLFEKVKIPLAQSSIHLIKIYIGDQMANAVGRCKIAKRKIEAYSDEEPAG
ncbi:MAG: V-type ATP synthase subunit D [Candidatus Omnitrophica bacterium]|nr:V-type ATP synthase subunit D [Candidatus Omnitrophota bacterium]